MNVIEFPSKPKQVNLIRSRDKALDYLLPQILGLLWDRGGIDPLREHAGKVVRLGNGVVIGGEYLVRGAFLVHVYDPNPTKVFSAHLAERAVIAPDNYSHNYHQWRCSILSWRRGDWENDIVAEQTEPRTIAHVLVGGMTKRA